MSSSRRLAFKMLALTCALGSSLPLTALAAAPAADGDSGFRAGHVFTSTNGASGNELLVYAASGGGDPVLQARVPTAGMGTGGGLGNQGAVTLSKNGRFVFVVNAASNTVSTFAIHRGAVQLRSTVGSGGERPVSVTERDGIVYVLNAGGTSNVTGFRNMAGVLHPLSDGTRALSAADTAPAQVGFSSDGAALVVTEKATNRLASFRVRQSGRLGDLMVTESVGATPFGFSFDPFNHLLVSEAFGGAPGASAVSSYGFEVWSPAKPMPISESVGTTQSAACWVVVTPNGRFAYVTNTASNTVSRYLVRRSGKVVLAQAAAASTDAGPIDAAVAADGASLYVLNAGDHTVTAYAVAVDGTLSMQGRAMDVPAGATGLAAN